MSDVFISYSRKDSDFAHKLDAALTREKREVWIDWQDIARGEDWWRSIQTGIDSADTALIVVTENWLVSEVCQRELDYIRQQNKRLFPIIRQKIEGDVAIHVKGTWVDQEWEQRARDNWKYIRSVNWIYFDDDTTFDTALKDLMTALDTDQLYVKSHTRYLVRALEWQQFKRNPSFLLEGDQLASAKEWLDSSSNKHPEPTPVHHEYVGASKIAETARIARDKAREGLIRRFRQTAIILGLAVVVAIIAAVIIGQQFIAARAEVTRAGATLQQVNLQVTAAINQQSTAVAQVQAADAQVATATIEQGIAVAAQRTSFARENIASTKVAIAGATLSPVPPTLTAVASAIGDALTQQDIANGITNSSISLLDKDYAGALATMNDLVNTYPDQSLAYIGRGLILDSIDRTDEAITDYTKAIEIDPENPAPYLNRAAVYAKLNDFDKAIADYNTSIEIDPEDVDSYTSRGSIYSLQGKYDLGLADFNQAIEIDPQSVMPYLFRGALYQNAGQTDEAMADYQQAVKNDPESAEAYNSIGGIYSQEGNYDEALINYNHALEINPQYSAAYSGRGAVYQTQNEYDKAIADYKEVIKIDPSDSGTYYALGTVYRFLDEPDLELESYNQAINLAPDYAGAYVNRAGVYTRMNKVEEASADFLKWIELSATTSDEADTVTHDQLPYNTTVTMTSEYAYHIPFEGRAGQLLQASAVAQMGDSVTVDALLVVVDADGNAIASGDDVGDQLDAEIRNFVLPADGQYTLIVSYGLNGSEGDLDVTLDLTSQAEATPTTP